MITKLKKLKFTDSLILLALIAAIFIPVSWYEDHAIFYFYKIKHSQQTELNGRNLIINGSFAIIKIDNESVALRRLNKYEDEGIILSEKQIDYDQLTTLGHFEKIQHTPSCEVYKKIEPAKPFPDYRYLLKDFNIDVMVFTSSEHKRKDIDQFCNVLI